MTDWTRNFVNRSPSHHKTRVPHPRPILGRVGLKEVPQNPGVPSSKLLTPTQPDTIDVCGKQEESMPDVPNPQAPVPNGPKPLKSTLNLPQTAFAMKASLPVNEPIRLDSWQREDLYAQIRARRAGSPRYILHDGPPYANGAIHLGHALNKCLKDFVVKTRTMAGYDAPYVPGWDCHGLPIEIKVDEQLGRKKLEMNPVEVRQACRAYAQKYLDLQRSQFIRMGIFGRWAEPYSTMDPAYEAHILETFYHFFENNFVYKGLKPVYWCIHDRTALAEAEVEYAQHKSPSIYVRYKLTSDPELIDESLAGQNVYTIIWTTTPWTIPASQAVAFNPGLTYVALATTTGTYIIAEELLASVGAACDLKSAAAPDAPATRADVVVRFPGTKLEATTYKHPFLDRTILGATADYVTADQGTGAVHTAPAHGVDDFATGKRLNLPDIQFVDDAGRQTNTHGQPYEGFTVFKSNPVITDILREHGALLSATTYEHSYPHCWRCHNPVIVRATEQWFIDMETPMEGTTFRQRALEEINRVTWDPSWGKERITNMVATRPDWCISRQRIWGVPIAIFLCRKCSEPLRSPAINKLVVSLFLKESADAWYQHAPEAILPAGTVCKHCNHHEFRKEMDILDVWFESGASSHAVMDFDPDTMQAPGDPDRRADLYAEGGDQHRGWFMSSLLCNIGMHNSAPFKTVATYGWTLDEKGRALSKSLGNFIDPVEVMNQLGGDIVRLWVASVDFREDVVASLPLLKRLAEEIYRKLRNTFRFLLGSLREIDPSTGLTHDFDPATDAVSFDEMQPIDQYILARTADLTKKITEAYTAFEFHRVYHALNEFCNSELSAFYLDILKDRLYTYPIKFKPGNPEQERLYKARRSAQTAIYKITDALARLTAPILSFTADEVWQSLPHTHGSVHLALFPPPNELQLTAESSQLTADWEWLLTVRTMALKSLEIARADKRIGKGLEASIRITILPKSAPPGYFDRLMKYTASLPELFNVSTVAVWHADEGDPNEFMAVEARVADGTKCDRCWRYTQDVASDPRYPTVCARCAQALDAIDFPPYTPEHTA
jgi:isoleucyl-tRNA synthetase